MKDQFRNRQNAGDGTPLMEPSFSKAILKLAERIRERHPQTN
jgi:hypothetical protein